VHALSGPPNDVEALRLALIRKWQVPEGNVEVLVNAAASRSAILQAIDRMINRAVSGDVVVLYYSGHGTSASDATSGFGMSAATGAIVPADLKYAPGMDPHSVLKQLIVGSTDLQPRLKQFDAKGVQVLVLFDACYSGDSAKSISRLTPRSADLLASVAAPGSIASFDNALKSPDLAANGWPYRNVVYISAATRYEVAWDISDAMARSQRPTIDGKAHGAFTNALLRGLDGAADTNHDGKITYSELHAFLVSELLRDGQTPQLHPSDKAVVEQPVLAMSRAPSAGAPAPSADGTLRIRLEGDEPLRAQLARIPGVQITSGAWDLQIEGSNPAYRIRHANGALLTPASMDASKLLQVIAKRARAEALLNLPFAQQDFNISLTLIPDQGAYYEGDPIKAQLKAERDSWLIVTDVDSEGNVILIYPHTQDDFHIVKAGEVITPVDVTAESPFGTDIVQALAFAEKPEGYDALKGTLVFSDDQLKSLIATLEKSAAKPGRARLQRVTFTSAKN
jgi:hypothetical protein